MSASSPRRRDMSRDGGAATAMTRPAAIATHSSDPESAEEAERGEGALESELHSRTSPELIEFEMGGGVSASRNRPDPDGDSDDGDAENEPYNLLSSPHSSFSSFPAPSFPSARLGGDRGRTGAPATIGNKGGIGGTAAGAGLSRFSPFYTPITGFSGIPRIPQSGPFSLLSHPAPFTVAPSAEEDEDSSAELESGQDRELEASSERAALGAQEEEDTIPAQAESGDVVPASRIEENTGEAASVSEIASSPRPHIPDSSDGPTPTHTPIRQIDRSVSAASTPSHTPASVSAASPFSRLRSIVRPFDRRFSSASFASPGGTTGTLTPRPHQGRTGSRAPSVASFRVSGSVAASDSGTNADPDAPWPVIKFTRLSQVSATLFSGSGRRHFGVPVCMAVGGSVIAIGMSSSVVCVFDYAQKLVGVLGQGSAVAMGGGGVTAVCLSADGTAVASGHSGGDICVWEISRPAKPLLHIPPIQFGSWDADGGTSAWGSGKRDGHVVGSAILHLAFLGARRTALVAGDAGGMAFAHLATRGLGSMGRTVETSRILGRYPVVSAPLAGPGERPSGAGAAAETPSASVAPTAPTNQPAVSVLPSCVLACATLPLADKPHPLEALGLTALLTPYLLVIVSTTPVARTQFKTRVGQKDGHGEHLLSGCVAWFPSAAAEAATDSVESEAPEEGEETSPAKLAYAWSNTVRVLEVEAVETEISGMAGETSVRPEFYVRREWVCPEAVVAVEWVSQAVLAVLSVSQTIFVLEDGFGSSGIRDGTGLVLRDSFDLVRKQTVHHDYFSHRLRGLIGSRTEGGGAGASTTGSLLPFRSASSRPVAVADAFFGSFKTFRGKIFTLNRADVSIGMLSNWADRLSVLVEEKGDYLGALRLATEYYDGRAEVRSVGLPADDAARHRIVGGRVMELGRASVAYVLRRATALRDRVDGGGRDSEDDDVVTTLAAVDAELEQLTETLFASFRVIGQTEYLLDEIYEMYAAARKEDVFFAELETGVLAGEVRDVPPLLARELLIRRRDGLVGAGGGTESDGTAAGDDVGADDAQPARLEHLICSLDVRTIDIELATAVCRDLGLWGGLAYVWTGAVGDAVAPVVEMLRVITSEDDGREGEAEAEGGSGLRHRHHHDRVRKAVDHLFPYLAHILTGRMYPSGDLVGPDDPAGRDRRADLLWFLFSGEKVVWPRQGGDLVVFGPHGTAEPTSVSGSGPDLGLGLGSGPALSSAELLRRDMASPYPYLRLLLRLDGASLLSVFNEFFEEPFLDSDGDGDGVETATEFGRGGGGTGSARWEGLIATRMGVVRTLLDVFGSVAPEIYMATAAGGSASSADAVAASVSATLGTVRDPGTVMSVMYLDMFIARNIAKFPQFVLLPAPKLGGLLVRLCEYPALLARIGCGGGDGADGGDGGGSAASPSPSPMMRSPVLGSDPAASLSPSLSSRPATPTSSASRPSLDVIASDCQLSVEYLLSVHRPPSLVTSLLPLFRTAKFFRVLRSVYKSECDFPGLVTARLDDPDPDERAGVFDDVADGMRWAGSGPVSGGGNARLTAARRGIEDVVVARADEICALDPGAAAQTLAMMVQYGSDADVVVRAVVNVKSDRTRFLVLRGLLEPALPSSSSAPLPSVSLSGHGRAAGITPTIPPGIQKRMTPLLAQQYIRLLCKFEPARVAGYIATLPSADLRLEALVPELERAGAVDAAVLVEVRAEAGEGEKAGRRPDKDGVSGPGKRVKAVRRVVKHLAALEVGLGGVLQPGPAGGIDRADGGPDTGGVDSPAETDADADPVEALLGEIEKYAQLGVWVCRHSSSSLSSLSSPAFGSAGPSPAEVEWTPDAEDGWVELLVGLIGMVHRVSLRFRVGGAGGGGDGDGGSKQPSAHPETGTETLMPAQEGCGADAVPPPPITLARPPRVQDRDKVVNALRAKVQQVFSVLLADTAAAGSGAVPGGGGGNPKSPTRPTRQTRAQLDRSPRFLRIFSRLLDRLGSGAVATGPAESGSARTPFSALHPLLADTFTSYTYESAILAIATGLVATDVAAAAEAQHRIRTRGWRPRGVGCAGCGARCWGIGTGMGVWDEWVREETERGRARGDKQGGDGSGTGAGVVAETGRDWKRGKSGARSSVAGEGSLVTAPARSKSESKSKSEPGSGSGSGPRQKPGLVLFACRHLYHRDCLVLEQGRGRDGEAQGEAQGEEESGVSTVPAATATVTAATATATATATGGGAGGTPSRTNKAKPKPKPKPKPKAEPSPLPAGSVPEMCPIPRAGFAACPACEGR